MIESIKEKDMKDIVSKYFEEIGYICFKEFRIGLKRIDLYFIHKHYPKTIAVELKVKNWKKALKQAYQNLFYAQNSYVGIWHETLNETIASSINNYGLGVLKVKRDTIEVIEKPINRSIGLFPSMQKILEKISSKHPHEFLWSDLS